MLDRFLMLAGDAPERPAIIDGADGQITTRLGLLQRASEIAGRMATAGLVELDLVGIQLPNSVDFVATVLAAAMQEIVILPLDRDAPEVEVESILAHFGARGLIHWQSRATGELVISPRAVTTGPAFPDETRLVKLTSGSTGLPKGIAVSRANLVADCTNICTTMVIAGGDINFGAIPFSHSYGFSNLVMPLLQQGTPVVISNDYLPQSIIDLCNRYRCTILPAIPMVFEHLAALPAEDGNFMNVRTCLSAGAPLSASTSRKFQKRFGRAIHSFYGCSECGGIAYDRVGAAAERGTVGAAVQGVTLIVTGSRLTVHSGAVALGYLHDAATFQPFGSGFATEDLVEWAANGELALMGRVDDLINTAGKKVNPREIELVLLEMEGVREAKVYGEAAGARGEVVAAAVVASPEVTREKIRDFCSERLSPHKVPRIIKLIGSIPVDERGKVRKSELSAL